MCVRVRVCVMCLCMFTFYATVQFCDVLPFYYFPVFFFYFKVERKRRYRSFRDLKRKLKERKRDKTLRNRSNLVHSMVFYLLLILIQFDYLCHSVFVVFRQKISLSLPHSIPYWIRKTHILCNHPLLVSSIFL